MKSFLDSVFLVDGLSLYLGKPSIPRYIRRGTQPVESGRISTTTDMTVKKRDLIPDPGRI